MKLVKANIYGFGKWIDQEFNFKQDYQVIFGSNEAGKTTLLNFIKSILFGFASARGDNKYLQYNPRNSSRYGGELELEATDGTIWTIRREAGKGDGKVTLFHENQQVSEDLLTEIVGGFTRDDFEHTHVFDDKNILSIYGLDENQLETEIMSVGAVGSKEWLETADKINTNAENIYKKRGQKQPLVVILKQRDELLDEKAEFENQQEAYQRVKNQLQTTMTDFNANEKLLKEATESENILRNLDKKWLRYEQLQQTTIPDDVTTLISNEDWENVLKDNQELSTIQETPTSNNVSTLDNVEKQILINYRNNQKQLDYIRNQKFELQNLQFHRDDMNSQLLKVDTQVDQLFHENAGLSEHMRPLSTAELDQITPQSNGKNNNIALIIAGVAVILAFVMSNPMRLIFIIAAIASGVWYWSQSKGGITKSKLDNYPFLKEKGYAGLSQAEIIALQGTVIQLDNMHTSQKALTDGIKSIEVDLNKWRKILIELNVLDSSYTGDNYNEQIEKYFTQLDQINAKADISEKNQTATQKMTDDRKQRLDTLEASIAKVLDKYQISSMNSFVQMHTNQVKNQKVINQIKQDKDFLGNDFSELRKYPNREALTSQLADVSVKKDKLAEKNNELSRQTGSLKQQMQQVFDNTQYQRVVAQLAQNKADIIENYDEWVSQKLASKWIREMLNIATENRYPKMMAKATQYFALLTNDNYVKINFNKEGIAVTSAAKNQFSVHELSQATTIQLYISLRLAFVTEIADLIKLPILIDDAFVDFDITRTDNVFRLIQEIAKNNQVIYVTANEPTALPADHILKLEGKEIA